MSWWWLLCPAVFVALVVATALAHGHRRSRLVLRVMVNLAALVAVGCAVVVGVHAAEGETDPQACQRPSATDEDAESDLQDGRRRDRPGGTAAAARTVTGAEARRPVPASVAETTPTTFDLGNDPSPGVRSIPFTLERRVAGSTSVAVSPTSFTDATTGEEVAPADLEAWAVLDPDRRSGTLYVCVPSDRREHLPSGRLTGSLVVDDPRVARLAPQVTLTLAYTDVVRVMLVGLAVALAASWYVFFLRRDQLGEVVVLGKAFEEDGDDADDDRPTAHELDERDRAARVLRWPFGFWWGYWRWATSASGVITIAAGMAAAVTAFTTAYLGSETWAASFGDWLAYIGAVATAFVAGGTAGKLAQISAPGDESADDRRRRRERRRRRAQSRPSPSRARSPR